MKKIVSLLIIFSFGLMTAFAQNATLRLGEVSGTVGTTVNVPIYIDVIDDEIKNWQFSVIYDPAVLEPIDQGGSVFWVNQSPQIPGGSLILQSSIASPGDWRFLAINFGASFPFDPAGAGGALFAEIPFNVIGDMSTCVWSTSKANGDGKLLKLETILVAPGGFTGVPFNLTLENGGLNLGPVATMWTGAVSNDWSVDGNWTAGVPADGADVTIPDVGEKAPFPVLNGAAILGMLTIDAGASLTVNTGGELTTDGLFTNEGDLIINSDPGGYSGSFIDNGGMAGAGFYTFNRDIVSTAAYGAMGGWHFLSTPVAGFENWDMYDYFVNGWDQGTQMYTNIEGTYTPEPGVPCDVAPQTVLGDMEAWSIKQDITYSTGTNFLGYMDDCETEYPGVGDNIAMMGAFADVNTGAFGPAAIVAGWNFYGNPYSSSIDPGMIAWGPNTTQAVYMWDGLTDDYYEWSSAVPNFYVAPTQGFFIEATGADALSFTGAERMHDAGVTYWGKSEITNLLTLKASGNDRSDNLYVRFMDNMTAAFDHNGDAHKLLSTVPGVPQIYTTVGSEMLAINALPETNMVPMGFTSVESGTFTIEAIETSEFSDVNLQDLVTGEVTDLLANSYTFDFTSGDDPNRFIIHFGALGVDDNPMSQVSIWSSENKVHVSVPTDISGIITIYNLMGQEVMSTDTQPGINIIPMDKTNAYYVVKVVSNDHAVTGKVYIK